MAPKIGRPPKENPKNVELGIRLTEETANKLKACADALGVSRTEIIEMGINLVEKSLQK